MFWEWIEEIVTAFDISRELYALSLHTGIENLIKMSDIGSEHYHALHTFCLFSSKI